jgi:hypothetical protein
MGEAPVVQGRLAVRDPHALVALALREPTRRGEARTLLVGIDDEDVATHHAGMLAVRDTPRVQRGIPATPQGRSHR